jgi:hypothetical protein
MQNFDRVGATAFAAAAAARNRCAKVGLGNLLPLH